MGLLEEEGVPFVERSEDELYNMLIPEFRKNEKILIKSITSFIILLKSSNKTIDNILRETRRSSSKRDNFLIKNIVQPIYLSYQETLSNSNLLDFTDLILRATRICDRQEGRSYKYIIVDEFQDISLDRFEFLKALRKGVPPAKLFCVGDDWQSIYRFSGSDISLVNDFSNYFGPTELCKITTTYRFGQPLIDISAHFIQKNSSQIRKRVNAFDSKARTRLSLHPYRESNYNSRVKQLIDSIPEDKSILLLGRYSFDDNYLSKEFNSIRKGSRFYYMIGNREIQLMTIHKSKGLEADYVIILKCNDEDYGFPSLISDDSILKYVLSKAESHPFAEERRVLYVGITRAKIETMIMYREDSPSIFIDELLNPDGKPIRTENRHPNAYKRWTKKADQFLLAIERKGKSIK